MIFLAVVLNTQRISCTESSLIQVDELRGTDAVLSDGTFVNRPGSCPTSRSSSPTARTLRSRSVRRHIKTINSRYYAICYNCAGEDAGKEIEQKQLVTDGGSHRPVLPIHCP